MISLRTRLTLSETLRLEAEASVSALSRTIKRTRAEHRKTRDTLGRALFELEAVHADLKAARDGAAKLSRAFKRLAERQLGANATAAEIHALTDRWLAAERPKVAELEATEDLLIVMIAKAFEPRLRGEDDHG